METVTRFTGSDDFFLGTEGGRGLPGLIEVSPDEQLEVIRKAGQAQLHSFLFGSIEEVARRAEGLLFGVFRSSFPFHSVKKYETV
jgi:hypothetical protein